VSSRDAESPLPHASRGGRRRAVPGGMCGRTEIPAASRPHARDDAGRARSGDAASLADSRGGRSSATPLCRCWSRGDPRSHDLRAAAARVEQARNQIVIARADMFPGELSGRGRARAGLRAGSPANATFDSFLGTFNLAWRSMSGAASGVPPSPPGGLSRRRGGAARRAAHAGERRGASLLRVARARPRARDHAEHEDHVQDTLDLFRRRYVGGSARFRGVARRAALTQARAGIPDLERRSSPKRTSFSPFSDGRPVTLRAARRSRVITAPEVPVGLPSSLLERRPDTSAGGAGAGSGERRCRRRRGELLPAPRSQQACTAARAASSRTSVKSAGNVWAVAGSLAAALPGWTASRELSSELAAWDEAVRRYRKRR